MITHRTNVFSGHARVTHNDQMVDGRPVPRDCLALFRTMWRRRGQWLSEHRLETLFSTPKEFRYELARLRGYLLRAEGFQIEDKVEKDEMEVDFRYFRLVTGETLPEPTRTGEAALEETKDQPMLISLGDLHDPV